MNLEVLVSTMNKNEKEIIELINKMNITGKAIIVDQINKKATESNEKLKANNQKRFSVIYDNKKGLSRSRNIALKKSRADIVLLADDDVRYQKDYENNSRCNCLLCRKFKSKKKS